ncbi:hypothetical protein D3Z45_01545 [Lachnospiraceae bacterium]|nr:hypothetical protein [Lachnospiraceae bacterium]
MSVGRMRNWKTAEARRTPQRVYGRGAAVNSLQGGKRRVSVGRMRNWNRKENCAPCAEKRYGI